MKLLALLTSLMLSVAANAQSHGGNNPPQPYPGHGGNNGMVMVQRELYCASNDYKYAECYTGLERTHQVYMSQQKSKSACIQGHSFNIYGDRITVSNGCRAVFVARGLTAYPQPNDQILEHTVSVRVRCESQGYNSTQCRIPLRRVRQVYLEQQHSKSSCIEGHSFFVNDRYITVTNGCRATFVANGIQ